MSRRVGLQKALSAAVLLGVLQTASPVLALGLGDMELKSFLNEPLRADVTLLDLRGLTADDIRIRLGGVEDFDRMGVERSYFLTSIQFEVVVDERTGSGEIRLTTEDAILEPYLDLIIEARWPSGRLLREYTVLVDPPAFRQDVLTVSASEEVRKTEAPSSPANEPVEEDPASSGGEEVTVRGSDLAPGQMPERPFSAETALRPEAGNRYMVKRDETLWQIASTGRPQNTSVQQAMLDIQRLNPEAFIDGNINRIKAGYIIYLPEPGDITSDDLASALEEVREQNQAFNSRRSAPGVTAAATATLRVSADSDTDSDTDATPSRDTIAGTATSFDDDPSNDEGVADDLQSVDDAEQNTAATSGDGVASAELAAQLNAMAGRLDTLEQIVALKDQQIATLEQALRDARETAAASAVSAAPAPVAAPAKAASSDTSSSDFPLWPLIAGIAAILAMLAFAVLRRRRASANGDAADGSGRDGEDDVFAGVSLTREALEPEELDETPSERADEYADNLADTSASAAEDAEDDAVVIEDSPEGGNRGYGERKHDDYIDEGSGGDALAEADIYIAYGRYLQAIELLNTAIDEEPKNSAYRLKLIELYVDMGEEGEAEQQLERLRASDDREAIARAEALVGGGLLPIDYAPLQHEAADQSVGADAEEVAEAPDVEEEPLDDSKDNERLVTVSDEELLEQADSAAFTQAVDSLEPIEFDGLQIADETVDDVAAQTDGELDIVSDLEDELDLSEALDDAGAAVDVDGSDEEELVIAEDADQMATKLDLARAYLDMGDGAGARAILEEVIGGGTGEQQQEARELLTRID
jgi:pilus assembly protein FimV